MNDAQIKYMVDRFLCWRLPRDTFNPDCGISFDKRPFNTHTAHPSQYEPQGTNLLDAQQATAMVRHMIEGMPKDEWRPAETCPENTWVFIYADWDDQPYRVGKFRWTTHREWEVVSVSSGKSGARRETRQEIITQVREWDDGTSGPYPWMPLPEPPTR